MDRNQIVNDPELAMRIILDGRQSKIWTAIPGIIDSVDFSDLTCSVQPTIQGVAENEDGSKTLVDLPLLIKVPLVFPKGGGFSITFPVAEGDEVLVVFSSRCIDAWWQSGGINRPMEARMHDLSDGFAIPGPYSVPNVIDSVSSSSLQIRNDAGTSYIEIDETGKIKLLSATTIDVVAPTINLSGTINIAGTLAVTGGISATGSISATNVTAGVVSLLTHVHSGVTTGGGTSGPPV